MPAVKEIQEFPPLLSYEPHIHYDPHLSLTHNLYVYPLSLNYESQKQFTKVCKSIYIPLDLKVSVLHSQHNIIIIIITLSSYFEDGMVC